MSCGLSKIDAIINAASQSSRIPCRENDAAMGMVPYMQSGDAMPSRHAGTMPSTPQPLPLMRRNRLWIPSLANTETAEPIAIPNTQ